MIDIFDVFFGGPDGGEEFLCPRTRKLRGRPVGRLGATASAIREAVLDDLVGRYERMTVRQAFYVLEVAGIVEKTEGGYRQVQKQLLAMRREGLLDWTFITDGTRWQRKPRSYGDVRDYVASVSRSYRRDLWQSQGVRIEVWLEKDALADVVVDVTARWDVALMVSRGQSSATFIHSAAMEAKEEYERTGAATYVYALYDHDAGGERSSRTIALELPEHAPGVPVYVDRLAVTLEQIRAWACLPVRRRRLTRRLPCGGAGRRSSSTQSRLTGWRRWSRKRSRGMLMIGGGRPRGRLRLRSAAGCWRWSTACVR